MSKARLWCAQGKRQQAHDLLAPVYDWLPTGENPGFGAGSAARANRSRSPSHRPSRRGRASVRCSGSGLG
jgi:hypothetical protein